MIADKSSRPCLLLVIMVLIGILFLEACASSTPDFTFVMTLTGENGDSDLYKVNYRKDEAMFEQLTESVQIEMFPTISPDGKWVLYKTGGLRLENRLYLLNLDTEVTVELGARGELLPGPWSPDGKRLTYISDQVTGTYRVYLVNVDAFEMDPEPLAIEEMPSLNSVYSFSWAPDNKKLAVTLGRDRYHFDPNDLSIFIYDLENNSLIRLTSYAQHGACRWPSWSPNGEWIAMVCRHANDRGQLYIITPDGKQLRQLTKAPEKEDELESSSGNFEQVWQPQWLPSEKHLVYIAVTTADSQPGLYMTDVIKNTHWLILEEISFGQGVSVQRNP